MSRFVVEWTLLIPYAILVCLCGTIFSILEPNPYMDEIFHYPQTCDYCNMKFLKWNDKITTFPGLYLIGFSVSNLISLCSGFKVSYCSLFYLRAINWGFSVGCFIMLQTLMQQLHRNTIKTTKRNRQLIFGGRSNHIKFSLYALTLCLLPTHFFFSFLYYTDLGSIFFILLAYSLALPIQKGTRNFDPQYKLSAVSCAIAVLFRQTNVVWVIYVAVEGICHDKYLNSTVSTTRQKKLSIITSLPPILKNILYNSLQRTFTEYSGYIGVVISFLSYVIYNGGIVLGDRDNHKPVLHLAQWIYIFVFIGLPLVVELALELFQYTYFQITTTRRKDSTIGSTIRKIDQMITTKTVFLVVAVSMIISYIFVSKFRIVHPFLLADNRHYLFYVIKNSQYISKNIAVDVVPMYGLVSSFAVLRLYKERGSLWVVMYIVACGVILVPTPLVEFRYFTTPFMLAHLQIYPVSSIYTNIIAVLFLIVNIGTLFVFLMLPFEWPDGSVARFMW